MGKFISDSEMEQMESKAPAKKKFISDEEMDQMAPQEGAPPVKEKGLLSQAGDLALDAIGTVGEYYDRYTGAPIRRGMLSLQAGKSLPEALEAGYEQIGEPTKYAPTGKELFENVGVSSKPLSEYIPDAFSEEGSVDMFNPQKSTLKKGGLLDVSPAGLLGFGFEMGSDPIAGAEKGLGKLKALKPKPGVAPEVASAADNVSDVAPIVNDIHQKPTSIESLSDLDQFVKNQDLSKTSELPTAERLRNIEQILPEMKHKPLGIHHKMLASKEDFDRIRTSMREVPGPQRQNLDAYELEMKREIQDSLVKQADQLSGDMRFDNNVQAGENLVKDINGAYEVAQAEARPVFQAIDSTPLPKTQHIPALVNRLATENPKLAQILEITPEGNLALKKVTPKTGLSKQESSLMQEVIEDLNSNSLTFKDLQNIREYLRVSTDPNNAKAFSTINGIRKSMLSHMEDMVQLKNPNLDVRAAFTKWAKNEKFLDDMGSVLGSDLRSADALRQNSPEKLMDRLFSNVNTTRFAKQNLSPLQFRAMAGQYVRNILQSSFDTAKNQASMAKLSNKIRSSREVLVEMMGPQQFAKLEALVDLGKIIPDAPSVNPSGTAKTGLLMSAFKGAKKAANFQLGDAAAEIAQTIDRKMSQKEALKILEGALKGVPEKKKAGFLSSVAKQAKAHKGLIRDAAKAANINQREENE